MDDDQQFCLRWNNHQSTLISVFDTLLENETLVDCTLAAEGKFLKAHKVVLSACSPYFATLLQEQYDKHPIFILKDVKYQELRAMMDYMYRGEVNISQDQLAALLKAAESLQIKGLSDNRTGSSVPKHEQPQQQHRGLGLPSAGLGGAKHVAGGYTLEQTKRARMGPASIDSQELSGSREGSSSPTSRRRRKLRRRSIENAMTEVHDNSNSSQIQPIATTSSLLQQQSNASLGGVGAITAAASALASQVPASAAAALPTAAAASTIATSTTLSGTTQQQQLTAATTSVTKKTEGIKGSSSSSVVASAGDAMHSEMLANIDEQQHAAGLELKSEKLNHKQQKSVLAKEAAAAAAAGGTAGTELVIEPKSEYDDEGNDENVEDLTLDDEDMGMEDLDHNAGTSHGNEGSSQGYAQWQHDRSQDEVYMGTQEAQQRDPQDAAATTTKEDTQSAQCESRIRVRNWLMLADKSILEKSIQTGTEAGVSDKLTNTNATTSNTNNTHNDTNTTVATTAAVTTAGTQITKSIATATTTTNVATITVPKSIDTNTQTMTRIGSIGRTTIACITPAGNNNSANSKNASLLSTAALAAAGVELDTMDDNTTDVIVKIENNASSDEEEDEEEEEEEPNTEDGEGDEDDDYNYDLKLSSPMSWAFDTVKIENEEEFEDIFNVDQDNNSEDVDDLLTTAAAAANNTNRSGAMKRRASSQRQEPPPLLTRSGAQRNVLKTRVAKKRLLNTNCEQPQLQQQVLHLPAIPATITSITTVPATVAGGVPTSKYVQQQQQQAALLQQHGKNPTEFQATLSDDKKYRILIQNQRMRKESLEHSEDMIYNADIEKPWVCKNCNRNYKWKNSLKCHLKNECGQPPRYFCSKLCGYATNVHSNLKRHLNTKCKDRMDEEQHKTDTYTLVLEKQE